MLNSKQRAKLRSYASTIDATMIIGKDGLTDNLLEQIDKQLKREPRSLPKMKINPEVKSIYDFKFEDFELVDYNPHKGIKGKVAV